METTLRNIKRFLIVTLAGLAVQGCIEPFEFEAENYEDVLVLDATITDEYRQHEIKLNRSFMLDEEAPLAESGARVRVTDDSGNVYEFPERNPGIYVAAEAFSALPNNEYVLEIVTAAGNTYESEPVTLAESSGIDDLYATRTTYNGDDGIALLVDNYNSGIASRYYRYKFEETYKIISRYSYDYDLIYDNGFIEVLKTKEETICYNTEVSNDIILANTTSLQENNIEDFLVRFIDSENPISSRRYSILVKQFAISSQAYAYYETLKNLSGSDNVFSQNQPGFVAGNVYLVENPNEKVVGMFNVSAFSSKRIYFNYSDFYGPEDSRPHFTNDCDVGNPAISPPPAADNLISLLELGWIKYLGRTTPTSEDEGPYKVVNAECVDCTLLGTNEVPDFWEED